MVRHASDIGEIRAAADLLGHSPDMFMRTYAHALRSRCARSPTRSPSAAPISDAHGHTYAPCVQSTSVRIDVTTHEELKPLAAELHTTVGNTVALAGADRD